MSAWRPGWTEGLLGPSAAGVFRASLCPAEGETRGPEATWRRCSLPGGSPLLGAGLRPCHPVSLVPADFTRSPPLKAASLGPTPFRVWAGGCVWGVGSQESPGSWAGGPKLRGTGEAGAGGRAAWSPTPTLHLCGNNEALVSVARLKSPMTSPVPGSRGVNTTPCFPSRSERGRAGTRPVGGSPAPDGPAPWWEL